MSREFFILSINYCSNYAPDPFYPLVNITNSGKGHVAVSTGIY